MPALPTTTSKVTSTLASSLRGGAGRDQRRLIVVGGLPPARDIQVRIQRKISWLGLDRGETAFWGGFSDVKDGFTPGSNPNSTQVWPTCPAGSLGVRANMLLPAFTFPGIPFNTQITSSDVNSWFLAFDQQLASAAMHLYVAYEHFNADVDLIDVDRNRVPISIDDFNLIYAGGVFTSSGWGFRRKRHIPGRKPRPGRTPHRRGF
jgi:hypothetical protein